MLCIWVKAVEEYANWICYTLSWDLIVGDSKKSRVLEIRVDTDTLTWRNKELSLFIKTKVLTQLHTIWLNWKLYFWWWIQAWTQDHPIWTFYEGLRSLANSNWLGWSVLKVFGWLRLIVKSYRIIDFASIESPLMSCNNDSDSEPQYVLPRSANLQQEKGA